MILFRWVFWDTLTGAYTRGSTAGFVTYTPTVPRAIVAYDLSRPFIRAYPAEDGATL
jgi:hypothetical protein